MKILIIKTSALGDIIHTFPVINFLKEVVSSATIDWVVEKEGRDLVARHPFINKTLTVETRKWRKNLFNTTTLSDYRRFKSELQNTTYDVVFDLQGNCKSGWITHLARSKEKVGFGRQTVAEWPNLLFTNLKFNPPNGSSVREDLLFIVKSYFKKAPLFFLKPVLLSLLDDEKKQFETIIKEFFIEGSRQILVCGGSNWENKQLDPSILGEFLKKLPKEKTQFLFLWGNEKEKERATQMATLFPSSTILPKMSLPLLQHVMTQVELIISMDSLPLHLACLTDRPTWSVFGPSSAHKYAPSEAQHQFFQGSCPYQVTFEKRCPKLRSCSTGACIKGITPDALFQKFFNFKSERSQ